MIVFDFIAEIVDRLFSITDRIRQSFFHRVILALVFLLLSAAAALYAQGKWDFPFIKRPEAPASAVMEADTDADRSENAGEPGSVAPEETGTPDGRQDGAPVTPDGNEGDDTSAPDGEEGGADIAPAKTGVAQMSDLSAAGYYVTTKDYDPALHRIAVLNVDLHAPAQYTLRQRNVFKDIILPSSTFEYGPNEVKTELVAEDRPVVEAYGGYLFVDRGDRIVVCDSYGTELYNFDESYMFAYTRDDDGVPLLYTPSVKTIHDDEEVLTEYVDTKTYHRLTRFGIQDSDYRDEIYSRGVHADLPPSYGAATEPYPRSIIVRNVIFLDLKYQLSTWVRTLWGFSAGYGDPFTTGWYDPAELAEEAEKAEEEYQKAVEEAKEKGEKPPKRPKKTALERYEEEKEAKKLWEETPSTAYNYSGGLACVANDKGQMWFIDHNGNKAISMKDVEGLNVVDGRPVVDNYLLPLTNGMESLGFYYFDHRLVRVRRQQYDLWQKQRYKHDYVTEDIDELIYDDGTKFPLPEGYDVISYSNGVILLKSVGGNVKYGYMDYTGAWIVPPELEDAKPFVEGLAPAESGGKWGVFDTAGNVVIPFAYDSIQTTSSGVIVCHYEGGWTVFSKMAKA